MLVSVITTSCNRIKYLEECIQSVLNQSYSFVEHILVDNCSIDGTVDLLADYQARYPDRIRFISEPDKGACDGWNKGIALARGDIFGWIGSDDAYEPDTITAVVEFFRKNPNAYFVYGNCNVIDEDGKLLGRMYAKDFDLKRAIHGQCAMFTPAVLFKREVYERVGAFDATINACDYDFYLRAGMLFKLHRIDKTLTNFRMHKGSVTCAKDSTYMYAEQNFRVARRYGATYLSPIGRAYLMSKVVRSSIRPVLTRIYYFKPLYPIISFFWELIVGKAARMEKIKDEKD